MNPCARPALRIMSNRQKEFWAIGCLLLLAVSCAYLPSSPQPFLGKSNLEIINKTVFEVVVLKPVKDSLTYERPLPLELLPYNERVGKYRSVGTAFAVGPNEFLTAAHVLNLAAETQYGPYYLRDVQGNVYAIDQILKYSSRRDFVLFSVKDRKGSKFLRTNTNPELNEKVYAVGNALGEGVIIRDGIYTSNTPEQFNGEWKWLRFSAAASPGNSGGPLLDRTGKVIGIILMKSPGENLNVALPIAEALNAKPETAHVFGRMGYFLDTMRMTKSDLMDRQIPLPKTYESLNREMVALKKQFAATLLQQLLAENKEVIFPDGRESLALLHKSVHAEFPHLISQGTDGSWEAVLPKEIKRLELEKNAVVSWGALGSSLLLSVEKPEDVSLAAFYKDSKLFMDLLLKALGVTRQIGIDKVKITSFGKARRESIFTDPYDRKWLVRTWTLEYNDTEWVIFSLPVPGGCFSLMRVGPTERTYGHIADLEVLTGFVYASYGGTVRQWREFLALKELLPRNFSTLDIRFGNAKKFGFTSPRVKFSVDERNLALSEHSVLLLIFGYWKEGGRTVWDIKEIVILEKKGAATHFTLSRHMRPPPELPHIYQNKWEKMAEKKAPFDRVSFPKEGSTFIYTVYSQNPAPEKMKSADVLYAVLYRKEGVLSPEAMDTALDAFFSGLSISESR